MAATVVNQRELENVEGGLLVFTPTAGNLLVMLGGGRDDNNSATPTFTPDAGWTKVSEVAPMEYHTGFIAWKVSDGTETSASYTSSEALGGNSFVAIYEINDPDVTTWGFDVEANDGSNTSNVSSISSGSTGTLNSADGVAIILGMSRTGSEGLSTDLGTSLYEVDVGSANFITAWLDLAATTALNATISESNGTSRMGAAVAVFNDTTGGGGPTVVTGTASGSIGATGTATATSAQGVTTGVATGTITASGSATGTLIEAVFTGTASGSIAMSASLTATPTQQNNFGIATGDIAVVGDATATHTEFTFTATASGSVGVQGQATGTLVQTVYPGTASGTISASGSVTTSTAQLVQRLSDSFNRADAVELGTADVGGVWSDPGSGFLIVGNQAAQKSVGPTDELIATLDAGVKNYTMSCDITLGTGSASPNLTFRTTNVGNQLLVGPVLRTDNDRLSLYKVVNGTYTLLEELRFYGFVAGQTYNIEVRLDDANIGVYVDGVLEIDYTLTGGDEVTFASQTRCGLRTYFGPENGNSRFDNFYVASSATAVPVATGLIATSSSANASRIEGITTGTASGTVSVNGTAAGTEIAFEVTGTASGDIRMSSWAVVGGQLIRLTLGGQPVDAVYIGTFEVDAIYVGDEQVFGP